MTLPELAAPRSLTENAYAVLRADILACCLVPGARIKIAEVCERLDVSLGAVREALSRLSAEGLVESEAQKGFRVAPVSAEDLDDLTRTRTRTEIETSCLRRMPPARDRARRRGVGDADRRGDAPPLAHARAGRRAAGAAAPRGGLAPASPHVTPARLLA